MSFYQTTIFFFALFYSICGFFTRNIVGEDFWGRLVVASILFLFFFLSLKLKILKKHLHRVSLVLFSLALLHYCSIWLNIHEQNKTYDVMYFLGFLVIAGGVFQSFIDIVEQVILGVIFMCVAVFVGLKIELMPLHFFLMNFLILLLCSIIVSMKIKFTNNQITDQIQKNFILSKRIDGQKQTEKIVNSLAHEINNPLAIISGTVSLLKVKEPSIDVKYLERIELSTLRISKIIKLMNCYLPGDTQTHFTDIHATILDFLELQKSHLGENGLVVRQEIPEGNIVGAIDKSSLVLVLEHLFNNAVFESLRHKSNVISIGVAIDDRNVKITVSNIGKVENPSTLFLPFSTNKDIEDGIGLGLYTCKFELEKFDGSVHLTRNDGLVEFTVCVKKV